MFAQGKRGARYRQPCKLPRKKGHPRMPLRNHRDSPGISAFRLYAGDAPRVFEHSQGLHDAYIDQQCHPRHGDNRPQPTLPGFIDVVTGEMHMDDGQHNRQHCKRAMPPAPAFITNSVTTGSGCPPGAICPLPRLGILDKPRRCGSRAEAGAREAGQTQARFHSPGGSPSRHLHENRKAPH